jgi:hypothetical protein
MFDPYHKWLGIPPGRRPPTHYQLLGITPEEKDRDVIEEAAIRQTSHLRTYQAGPHAADCAKLLNEIAQAQLVLLDPVRRKEYDAELLEEREYLTKAKFRPYSAPLASEAGETVKPIPLAPQKKTAKPKRRPHLNARTRAPSPVVMIVVTVGLTAMAVLGAVIMLGRSGGKDAAEERAERAANQTKDNPPPRTPPVNRPPANSSGDASGTRESARPSAPRAGEEPKPTESTSRPDDSVAKEGKPDESATPAKPADPGGAGSFAGAEGEEPPPVGRGAPVALRAPAPPGWGLKTVTVGLKLSIDRPYSFTKLPKEVLGGVMLTHHWAEGKLRLPPGRLTAARNCTIYGITMIEHLGQVDLNEAELDLLKSEGWTLVSGAAETSSPPNEGWKWIVLKKELKKGADPADSSNQRWGQITAFVFK